MSEGDICYQKITPCPMCAQRNINSDVRWYKINFEESVQLCTASSCHYPLGTEDVKVVKHKECRFLDDVDEERKKTASKIVLKEAVVETQILTKENEPQKPLSNEETPSFEVRIVGGVENNESDPRRCLRKSAENNTLAVKDRREKFKDPKYLKQLNALESLSRNMSTRREIAKSLTASIVMLPNPGGKSRFAKFSLERKVEDKRATEIVGSKDDGNAGDLLTDVSWDDLNLGEDFDPNMEIELSEAFLDGLFS